MQVAGRLGARVNSFMVYQNRTFHTAWNAAWCHPSNCSNRPYERDGEKKSNEGQ